MAMVQNRFCLFYEGRRPVRIIGFIFTKSGVMAHPDPPPGDAHISCGNIFIFCYTICIFGVVPSPTVCGRAMHAMTDGV